MKLLLTFFIFFMQVFAFAVPERNFSLEEIDKLRIEKQGDLEKKLSVYLGDIKFAVFLRLNSRKIRLEKERSLFFLTGSSVDERYRVRGFTVSVSVYESLRDEFDNEIKKIISEVIEPYPLLKVDVEYVESTRFISKQLRASEETTKSFFDKIIEDNSVEVLRLITVVIISLFGLFGFVILARLIKGPLHMIAEGLKKGAGGNSSNTKSINDETSNHSKLNSMEEAKKFRENLEVFKSLFERDIDSLIKYLFKSPEGIEAIRKTLPYLCEERYLNRLKESLTKEQLDTLKCRGEVFKDDTEYFKWFNQNIEDLSICTMDKGGPLISCLSKEYYEKLKQTPVNKIISFIKSSESVVAYHLALDILKEKDKERLVTSFEVKDWNKLIDVKSISVREIVSTVEKIFNFNPAGTIGTENISADVIKDSIVLPSVVSVLPMKDLKLQDDFVNTLSKVCPSLRRDLREVYWVPQYVFNVPGEYIKDILRDFSLEDKVSVINSMPGDVSEYLKGHMGEGRMREMLDDRLSDEGLKKEDKKSDMIARKLLDRLHSDYRDAKFDVLEKEGIENELTDNLLDLPSLENILTKEKAS